MIALPPARPVMTRSGEVDHYVIWGQRSWRDDADPAYLLRFLRNGRRRTATTNLRAAAVLLHVVRALPAPGSLLWRFRLSRAVRRCRMP